MKNHRLPRPTTAVTTSSVLQLENAYHQRLSVIQLSTVRTAQMNVAAVSSVTSFSSTQPLRYYQNRVSMGRIEGIRKKISGSVAVMGCSVLVEKCMHMFKHSLLLCYSL